MSTRTPNTPGFLGYLVAFGFGTVVFVVLTVPFADPEHVDAMDVGLGFVFLAVVFAILSFGILVLQAWAILLPILVAMHWFERQWVHVVAAGATAALFGLRLAPEADRPLDRVVLVVALAISMALGRLVVVPVVEDRRTKAGLR